MSIYVITDNKTGMDKYYRLEEHTAVEMREGATIKKYATLTDAIKDSEQYKNPHYSDGECLDYVLDVIQQLERDYHEIHS